MPADESSLQPASTVEADAEPARDVNGMTLRRQVLEIISDVLADSDPRQAWARDQLQDLLAARPGEPEQALLEHLAIRKRLTDSPNHDVPAVPSASGEDAVAVEGTLLTAFQPIRELAGGKLTGFEALARFGGQAGSGPAAWFQGAAAMGMGLDLEAAALQRALAAARTIPPHLFVAFNLSPEACADPRILSLLLDGNMAPDRIVVEITGQMTEPELAALAVALEPLRERGLRLAVDGSGPAEASPKQILHLSPDLIKLDRTFLGSVLATGMSAASRTVFEIARQTGAVLSAEGIENSDELAAVMDLGITLGQGYLLGRPSIDPVDWSAWTSPGNASEAVRR